MNSRGDAREMCNLVWEHPILEYGNRGGKTGGNRDIRRGWKFGYYRLRDAGLGSLGRTV